MTLIAGTNSARMKCSRPSVCGNAGEVYHTRDTEIV
jgi:hypothetical protein